MTTCRLHDMCEKYIHDSPWCEGIEECDYFFQLLQKVEHPEKLFEEEDLIIKAGDLGLNVADRYRRARL